MKFRPMKGCGAVWQQRIVHAFLEAYRNLPPPGAGRDPENDREHSEGQAEGRALIAVLLKNKSPETVSRETSVPVGRIYELRRNFYAAYWPM